MSTDRLCLPDSDPIVREHENALASLERKSARRAMRAELLAARRFRRVYARLAKVGACHTPGCDYHRILTEWLSAGRPRPIAQFIRSLANVVPVR